MLTENEGRKGKIVVDGQGDLLYYRFRNGLFGKDSWIIWKINIDETDGKGL